MKDPHYDIRKVSKGYNHGLDIRIPSIEDKFSSAISDKFGINSKITVLPGKLELRVQSIQSAQTLLNAFKRHKVMVQAENCNNYTITIPIGALSLLKIPHVAG